MWRFVRFSNPETQKKASPCPCPISTPGCSEQEMQERACWEMPRCHYKGDQGLIFWNIVLGLIVVAPLIKKAECAGGQKGAHASVWQVSQLLSGFAFLNPVLTSNSDNLFPFRQISSTGKGQQIEDQGEEKTEEDQVYFVSYLALTLVCWTAHCNSRFEEEEIIDLPNL